MWILPSNHPLSSAFAPEYAASNEDLKEYFHQSEPSAMWKSKPLLWKTYLLQWKKVWWLRHLSGRILKPSTRTRFEASLTELLVATRANRLAMQEEEGEQKTQGTCGLSFDSILRSYNRDGVFSKMLQDTSRWALMSLKENWKSWATSLRQESTLRRKSARLTRENDCSSLQLNWNTPTTDARPEHPDSMRARAEKNGYSNGTLYRNLASQVMWTTPVADDASNRNTKYAQGGTALGVQAKQWGTPRISTNGMKGQVNPTKGSRVEDQVLNWPAPVTTDAMEPKTEKAITREMTETRPGRTSFSNLRDAAVHGLMANWTTPSTRDYKDTPGMVAERTDGRSRNDQLPRQVFSLQAKESSSTHGKNPARLNPAWSIQLMGTTLQKTFIVPLVIRSLNKQQNLLSETSPEKYTNGSDTLQDDWVNT
jgi:hypothetical protein